jgi:Tfp pilus assembly protein PilV
MIMVIMKKFNFAMRPKSPLFLRIVIIALVAVIIGTIIVGAYVIMTGKNNANTGDSSSDVTAASKAATYNGQLEIAQNTAAKEGAVAGQAVLDKSLDSATTDDDKATVYGLKASLASSEVAGADIDLAIDYAKKADQLNPTSESAALLAYYYETQDDKATAIQYYTLAKTRIGDYDKADFNDQSSYDFYTTKIEGLK